MITSHRSHIKHDTGNIIKFHERNQNQNRIFHDSCKSLLLLTVLLTHWGRVTHICVSRLTIIGSDNGLSPGRRQAIIWTNAGMLLIGPLGTNFSESSIEILKFSFTKMRLKVSSAKWRPFCLGLNVLKVRIIWPVAIKGILQGLILKSNHVTIFSILKINH